MEYLLNNVGKKCREGVVANRAEYACLFDHTLNAQSRNNGCFAKISFLLWILNSEYSTGGVFDSG